MATIKSRAPRELSSIATEMADEPGTGPYTVHVDCILTRRKRHHMIENSEGGIAFRSRWMSDIVEWLAAAGETTYALETSRDRFAVAVHHETQIRRYG